MTAAKSCDKKTVLHSRPGFVLLSPFALKFDYLMHTNHAGPQIPV